jgi:hypothetical protein
MRSTCPAHLILRISLIIFGKGYKLWCCSIYSLFQPPTTPSLLGPNILLSALFSDTLSQDRVPNSRAISSPMKILNVEGVRSMDAPATGTCVHNMWVNKFTCQVTHIHRLSPADQNVTLYVTSESWPGATQSVYRLAWRGSTTGVRSPLVNFSSGAQPASYPMGIGDKATGTWN